MTELEEAELTDGQGRALSAHKSRAYEGLRQTNDGTGTGGNPEAACAPDRGLVERAGNRISE